MVRGKWFLLLAGFLVAAGAAAGQGVSGAAAARFLQQASWGPTAGSVAHVQAVGFSAWIDEQFGTPASPISDVPPNANGTEPMGPVQQEFFYNAVNGADQLRQRKPRQS